MPNHRNSGLITSILRFTEFFLHNPEVDLTYSVVYLLVYSICESGIYLVAACLPTFKPLANLFRQYSSPLVRRLRSTISLDGHKARASGDTIILQDNLKNTGFERINDNRTTHSKSGKNDSMV